MHFRELKTPCALVDLPRLERNARLMAARARDLSVKLRPHVKTHKCTEIARLQVESHFGGITVSTLAEARLFARAGFRDITYAVPLSLKRLDEALSLHRELGVFTVLVDHEDTAQALSEFCVRHGTRFHTLLEIDCGDHRAGMDPEDPHSLERALRIADMSGLAFQGLLTHAGHSYACTNAAEIRRVAEQERDVLVAFAQVLEERGVEVPTRSLGSTPTLCHPPAHQDGITEVRPGNYIFFDVFQQSIGAVPKGGAIAFSVLATTLGTYASQEKLIVDAGALALSKDAGAGHLAKADEPRYGQVVDLESQAPLEGLTIYSLSQEHGQIRATQEALARLPIGTPLRIHPNHSCLTAAMFERYHVVRGTEVVDEWRPGRGW